MEPTLSEVFILSIALAIGIAAVYGIMFELFWLWCFWRNRDQR